MARDYDPQTGRYVESDPVGIGGGINTYGYAGGNSLTYYDPSGLWAVGDPLPHPLVDAFLGYGSYYRGLGSALKHIYWRTGFAGRCRQQHEVEDEAIAALALSAIDSHPKIRSELAGLAKDWILNNQAYMAGRFAAGGITSYVVSRSGFEFGGGLSLTAAASMGSALDEIDAGRREVADIARGAIMGDYAPPAAGTSACGCSQ